VLFNQTKSSGTISTMNAVILIFARLGIGRKEHVCVHKVGKRVDENNADAASEIDGFQLPGFAAPGNIFRILTRVLYYKTPTEGLSTTP
jgi:hypothetical protein